MRSASVYAVPDDPVGDRVMVAVEVVDPDAFDVDDVRRVPRRASPTSARSGCRRFVRVTGELPEAREHEDRQDAAAPRGLARARHVVASRTGDGLRPLGSDDRARLDPLLDRVARPGAAP